MALGSTREEAGFIFVLATILAATAWYSTELTGMQRVSTTVGSWLFALLLLASVVYLYNSWF